MVEVRQQWAEFIEKGQLSVAKETALAMILGVSALGLHNMARQHQSLWIQPGPSNTEWTFIKVGSADFGSSLRQSYTMLYDAAAQEVNSGQRPDDVGEYQAKLVEVWELMPIGMQTELLQLGKSPDQLGKNLGN